MADRTITPDDIARVLERDQARTPGQWREGTKNIWSDTRLVADANSAVRVFTPTPNPEDQANAAYIAGSTDPKIGWAAMTKRVQELEADNGKYEKLYRQRIRRGDS